jgi:hypothetical protein
MPNLDEFIGPKPEKIHKIELEKIGGAKPCSKCEKDSEETFWDPINLIMSWTCIDGHSNTFKVN